MNKECLLGGHKPVVIDEFGNTRIVENYINLEKVLDQENIVEIIDKAIKLLKQEVEIAETVYFFPNNTVYQKKIKDRIFIFSYLYYTIYTILFYKHDAVFLTSFFLTIQDGKNPLKAKKLLNLKQKLNALTELLLNEKNILEELKNDINEDIEEENFFTKKIYESKKFKEFSRLLSSKYHLPVDKICKEKHLVLAKKN